MAHDNKPVTSELLATYLHTNPVLIRTVLAGLRDRGYVNSLKGHGGGWVISCDLKAVTLLDIYEAVGAPTVFAMGNRTENPACLVEQVVNNSLASAFRDAEALLIDRLGHVSLADLSQQFNQKFDEHIQQGAQHGHTQHKP
ncbi:Rrf2 family transcriptional regulator [Undibacterium sp.]|uniref:Rrf2 family transcriptional regulator n=1 Tax=Undibacterium sp. TaxID=1914977 RepID=UPI00374D0559